MWPAVALSRGDEQPEHVGPKRALSRKTKKSPSSEMNAPPSFEGTEVERRNYCDGLRNAGHCLLRWVREHGHIPLGRVGPLLRGCAKDAAVARAARSRRLQERGNQL